MKSLKVLLLIVLTLSMCAGNVYAKKTDNEELNLRWTRQETSTFPLVSSLSVQKK